MKSLLFLLFLSFTLHNFSSPQDSIKNAINFFEKYEVSRNFNIRTARELRQRGETVTTINHKSRAINGYTRSVNISEEYIFRVTFFKGYEYAIIASGDDSIIDIDLFVYDSQGNIVARDQTFGASAYARFDNLLSKVRSLNNDPSIIDSDLSVRPLLSERYWIKIKLREGKNPKGNIGLIIGNRPVN